MMTASDWLKMRNDAKTELAAMGASARKRRAKESDLLVVGGKISPQELARVDAFCELLAMSMQIGDDDKPRFTGRTQELVQVLLRNLKT